MGISHTVSVDYRHFSILKIYFLQIPSKARKDSSDSPLISQEAGSSPGSLRQRRRRLRRLRPRQLGSEDEDLDEDEETATDDEIERGGEEGDTPEHEMEYCDPCYCYGKCCLDIVASIFCVSLL